MNKPWTARMGHWPEPLLIVQRDISGSSASLLSIALGLPSGMPVRKQGSMKMLHVLKESLLVWINHFTRDSAAHSALLHIQFIWGLENSAIGLEDLLWGRSPLATSLVPEIKCKASMWKRLCCITSTDDWTSTTVCYWQQYLPEFSPFRELQPACSLLKLLFS